MKRHSDTKKGGPVGPSQRQLRAGELIRHALVDILREEELAVVKARMEAEDLSLIALRFEGDKHVPCARFQALEHALGSRVEAITLPEAAARQGTGRDPHSVLTIHLDRDDPDGETMRVYRKVLAFFKARTGA